MDWKNQLTRAAPQWPLAALRIFFGGIMLAQCSKLWARVAAYEQSNGLVFPFGGLEFIQLADAPVLRLLVGVAALGAVLVIIGWKFRWGSILWGLVASYFLLSDQLYFNNHYYLFALLAFLLAATDADGQWSVKARQKGVQRQAPYWQVFLLQFQLAIVYFYGGLAKLNGDWLSGSITIEAAEATFGVGQTAELFSALQTYGGVLFDLLVPLLLFYKPTRLVALLSTVAFHVFNGWFFDDIGLFPVAMLAATVLLFWPFEWSPIKAPAKRKKSKKKAASTTDFGLPSRALSGVLLTYFAFQLLFPFRHHLIASQPEWSGQGHYFAWRMKSYRKDITQLEFVVRRNADGTPIITTTLGFDEYTRQRSAAMPSMVKHLAHIVEKLYLEQGQRDFYVTTNYQVAFNGRPAIAAIDPNASLTGSTYQLWQPNAWVMPLGGK